MAQSSNQNYSNLQDRNAQIILDIQNLQNIERELFNNLEQSLSQNTLSQSQKETLVQKINEISQMRSNMYQTIGGINSFYQSNLNTSTNTLAQQTAAISIVEKELNAAKERLKLIEEYKVNKLRLVEINTYYGERYAAHSYLMKIVIYMFVPILILAVLANKGFVPNWLFSGLTIIIAVIGLITLFYAIRSIMMRDNMIFQEYDWSFDPNSAPKASSSSSTDPWASSGSNMCIGQACCDTGYTYDPTQNKCIPSSQVSSTTSESFISNIFTKYSKADENKKPDYTMGDKLPVSYAST
uniref:Uncharacterized protein n=1 Tax=viral metagenome TaxID=1070528 RepID=A0A6C0DUP0_9ZZZZ